MLMGDSSCTIRRNNGNIHSMALPNVKCQGEFVSPCSGEHQEREKVVKFLSGSLYIPNVAICKTAGLSHGGCCEGKEERL